MINQIQSTIQPIGNLLGNQEQRQEEFNINSPNFLDVFRSIVGGAAETQEQKSKDMLDLMLGNIDDLERIQGNITKAQVALELLVNTRNAALEAYNEIIKMSI
jgi:flagellar hook-basal body complex protein FliE